MLARKLALRNLRSDWFGTLAAIIGVALGTATVNVVLILDVNTRHTEARQWSTNPTLEVDLSRTVGVQGILRSGAPAREEDAKEETHEDYQVMRSAIRLGSLSAFLVGALIVFFTFGVVIERRKREIALLRSLGAKPRQVARVILLEAAIVGALGAALGLFASLPMSAAAAMAGITTTGRATIRWMWFPWREMLVVGAVGGATAILGALVPAYRLLSLDVPGTLRPRFAATELGAARSSSGLTLITLPFMALLYTLMRPFFVELLPSLGFFVLEAGLVCLAFLSVLVFVPEVVRALGGAIAAILPRGPRAAHLLVVRRVRRMGYELAWSVGGLMLVFGLLLSLHLVTRSLKLEVVDWASRAAHPYTFVFARHAAWMPALPALPERVEVASFSERTPWPNPIAAVDRERLLALLRAAGREDLLPIAERLGPGRVILSSLMARRFGVDEGDALALTGAGGEGKLLVAAVHDEIGYVPVVGPYRNSKTYAIIDDRDFGLIAPYAERRGAFALADPEGRGAEWLSALSPLDRVQDVYVVTGPQFERARVRETNRDFAIFDLILFLTTLLAAIGIANNLVLAVHARRREIALYRVLGMTARQVRQLFLMEGAFIGLLGGPLAALLGVPLGYAAIGALRLVSTFDVRFDLPLSYLGLTILGATLVALVAAVYPARRAGSSHSAESVHYE